MKIKTRSGDTFKGVFEVASKHAIDDVIVEFDFNGITCLVGENTQYDPLYQELMDAFVMGWKTIGPENKWEYDADVEIALREKQLEKAKKRKASEEAYQKKYAEDEAAMKSKLESLPPLSVLEDKKAELEQCIEINSKDPYSKCCVDYAIAWGRFMEVELAKGSSIEVASKEAGKEVSWMGITGFMYGVAVNILSEVWKHGEELRKWHNKKFGVAENVEGTVNPALFNVNATG